MAVPRAAAAYGRQLKMAPDVELIDFHVNIVVSRFLDL